jgi:hypothetical protein
MRDPAAAMRPVVRRLTAVLMVLVVALIPLFGTLAAASATPQALTTSALSKTDKSTPKPCSKAVLPGTVNTCPFAGVSLTGLPPAERVTERPFPVIQVLRWRSGKAAFAPQCGTSSPYRPPCLS